jgi:DNA-binding beta-propeller fold protein YncE
MDGGGNIIVTDYHRIRLVTPQGRVSTLAGGRSGHRDGEGTVAQFCYPTGIAVDGDGNVIVADRGNDRIRRVASDLVIPRPVELGNNQSTLGNLQSTLGNLQSTLGNIQSTLGNIQSTFLNHGGKADVQGMTEYNNVTENVIKDMTMLELRAAAKSCRLRGYSKMRKAELLGLLNKTGTNRCDMVQIVFPLKRD